MRRHKEPPMPEYAPPRTPYIKLFRHIVDFLWIVVKILVKLTTAGIILFIAFVLAMTWGK